MDIFFSHANGFPAKSYGIFFDYLQPHHIHYINAYGLESGFNGRDWRPFSRELIRFIRSKTQHPVVGLGHSFGGAVTYWAAQMEPSLFSHVIMLDTPFFGPLRRNAIRIAKWLGVEGRLIPPARKARKRRDYFASREQALDYFASKPLFFHFHPQALSDYVRYGLVEENGLFRLLIPPALEYKIFCASAVKLGPQISVPSWFVYATPGGVLSDRDLQWNRRYFSRTKFVAFEGGHMFPLEQPEAAARLIKSLIEEG